jgi:hypothetical protein
MKPYEKLDALIFKVTVNSHNHTNGTTCGANVIMNHIRLQKNL